MGRRRQSHESGAWLCEVCFLPSPEGVFPSKAKKPLRGCLGFLLLQKFPGGIFRFPLFSLSFYFLFLIDETKPSARWKLPEDLWGNFFGGRFAYAIFGRREWAATWPVNRLPAISAGLVP